MEAENKLLVASNQDLRERLGQINRLASGGAEQLKKVARDNYSSRTHWAWDAQSQYVIAFQGEKLKRDQFVREHGGEALRHNDPRVVAHRAALAAKESEEQADADLTRMDEEAAAEIEDGNTAEDYFKPR